jgi:hypothetical protein
VAAVTTQIDDRNVVAGPRVPLADLMQRCATDGFSKATRLLTYNIKAMSDTPDGVKVIKAYFNKQFHEQAVLLTEVLEASICSIPRSLMRYIERLDICCFLAVSHR